MEREKLPIKKRQLFPDAQNMIREASAALFY